ncbi:hypothetical protein SAMN05880501_11369 [Ureibacillus xyleni]|uniref:Uncharacterized protein n=1 Tax=Ureibacillus xyleni TaxID=614648 RepID=A0A285TI77_9BACL|nr:hypothetical protein [Ureibacillus xyleni]SOC21824.1 hypothetical protein SAMN05880501_11369 [Ureibacillus xyleni]
MENKTTKLYEFRVMVEEDLAAQLPYQVYVNFLGESEFYERLVAVAKRDRVLLTGRPAPFMMKLLFKTKYLFYLEQQTNQKLKFLHWSLEGILGKKKDMLLFKDREFVIEFREALLIYLNQFAKEVEQGKL